MVGLLVQRLHLRLRDCPWPRRLRTDPEQIPHPERNRRGKVRTRARSECAEPAKNRVARPTRRGKGVPRPVVPVAGLTGKPNRLSAKSNPKRRVFPHEPEKTGKAATHGAVLGKKRRHCEKPSRLGPNARLGGNPDASVRLTTYPCRAGACPALLGSPASMPPPLTTSIHSHTSRARNCSSGLQA